MEAKLCRGPAGGKETEIGANEESELNISFIF